MKTLFLVLFSVLLFVSVFTGAFNVQSAKANASSLGEIVQAADPDWWPMFHHDTNHTGTSTSTGPTTNNTLWNYTTAGSSYSFVEASPAVVDGLVYVGNYYGYFYCLNATNGAFVWSYTTGTVYSSPAVVGDLVYVGSATDGKVYCLNATNGAFVWSYKTGAGIAYSSPAVVDGLVYVGSEDGYVYCLNATDGAFVWSYKTGAFVFSSPAVGDGLVYVGSNDGNVYCLNATDGAFVWSYKTGDSVVSSPAVVGGLVYVGSWPDVYCLNATTGAFVWSYKTGNYVESSPAVVGGFVYVGSEDGSVYCLNAVTGAFVWSYTTGGSVSSSPAVVGGLVYVGSDDNSTYCFKADTGALVWSYKTGGVVFSSPAVVDGVVYVGSNDGMIYAFSRALFFVTFYVTNNPGATITFSGTTYTSGQTGQYAAGNYSAWANVSSGYSFYTWGYSGGVEVVGGLNPTTVQVTGNGSLDAELDAQVTFYTSPGNVGTIRWGADSPPDHTNGQSIYDYFYYNTVYVKATNVPGYTFAHWASSWSLTNATANPTNVTFTGPGWIEAYYMKNTYLVVRGNDNGIYYCSYAGSSWSGWTKLLGSTTMSPSASVFNNKLQIVVVGTDNSSLWYGNVNLGTSIFSGWTKLSGSTPSAPTLTSNGTALCLVVRGMDNRIYCSWYAGSWGPWQAVPTGTTGDTPATAILGNDLHIVVRGSDGQSLWDTIVRYNGTVARGWMKLSGATPSRPVLASYSSSNKLYLVVRGSNNLIYYQAYNGSTDSWQGWTVVPGATIDGPAATVANDDLHIAVRGTDGNTLWHGYVSGLNTTYIFSGWTRLSGSTPSTPTLAS